MEEQRHINLLEAYIDSRLTADERKELEGLLVSSAAMRLLFWETMQQHAFTQELLSEAQGRSIALTESRAATLEALKKEAARMGGGLEAVAQSKMPADGADANLGLRLKTGRQAGVRRTGRAAAAGGAWIFWGAVAAGLILAVVAGGWYYTQKPASVQVAQAQPTATVQTVGDAGGYVIRGTTSERLAAAQGLFAGDLVKTNPGGKDATATVVSYADGTRLSLAAGTSLTFKVANSAGVPGTGKHLELDAGSLTAAVTPQPAGQPMLLSTFNADVKIVGTQFTLGVIGAKTKLVVQEGQVQLTRRSDSRMVEVGARQFVEAGDTGDLLVRAVEEPRPPVVASVPKPEPDHPVPRGDELGKDEVVGRVVEIGEKRAGFAIKVARAGNHEMVGREMSFAAEWDSVHKAPREADVKQIRELRVGDVVRIKYYFEEHFRFRALKIVERARREEEKLHKEPGRDAPPAKAKQD